MSIPVRPEKKADSKLEVVYYHLDSCCKSYILSHAAALLSPLLVEARKERKIVFL